MEDTITAMAAVTKRFSYEESREQLREAKQAMGEKFRQPRLWSETGSPSHAADTIGTFQENEAAMRHVLAAQTIAGDTGDRDLQKLRGMFDLNQDSDMLFGIVDMT